MFRRYFRRCHIILSAGLSHHLLREALHWNISHTKPLWAGTERMLAHTRIWQQGGGFGIPSPHIGSDQALFGCSAERPAGLEAGWKRRRCGAEGTAPLCPALPPLAAAGGPRARGNGPGPEDRDEGKKRRHTHFKSPVPSSALPSGRCGAGCRCLCLPLYLSLGFQRVQITPRKRENSFGFDPSWPLRSGDR